MARIVLFLILFGSLARAQTAPPPASTPAPAAASGSPSATSAASPEVSGAGSSAVHPASPSAPKITWSHVNVDGPYIAMTFDDGPHVRNTPRLLDLAAKKHIKLTFFLIGENAARYPDLVQRELAEGHEVGNHSYTHPDLAKMSDGAVRSEIQKTQDAIVKASGYKPTLMRPPYGAMSARQRLWVNHDFGFQIILWEVDPLDWKEPGVDVVARRIIAGTHPGSIILSHDIHTPTVAAMPQVFDALLAKGYKFVTVSELIAMDKGPLHSAAKKPAADAAVLPPAPAVLPAPAQ